jgi:hypothetical protein
VINQYHPKAVDAAIASSNRAGRKIGRREAKLIHALLKGRTASEPKPPEA